MMNLCAERMSVKVLPVKLPAPEWPTVLVTLKNRTLNPAVKLFIDQVRAELKSLNAQFPPSPRSQAMSALGIKMRAAAFSGHVCFALERGHFCSAR